MKLRTMLHPLSVDDEAGCSVSGLVLADHLQGGRGFTHAPPPSSPLQPPITLGGAWRKKGRGEKGVKPLQNPPVSCVCVDKASPVR